MAHPSPETGPGPALSADSSFCPECGKPLTPTWRHDGRELLSLPSTSWGLVIAGFLFLLVVGVRTWTARDNVIILQSQFHALDPNSKPQLVGPARNSTSAGEEEQFVLFADLVQAQNRVGEAPIAAGLALIVIVAGFGANGLPGRQWRPKSGAMRGSLGDRSTRHGVVEPAGRRIWVLGHSLSMATVILIVAIYCGSVGFLLIKGAALTPSLFDAALTRTIDAIVTLAGTFM